MPTLRLNPPSLSNNLLRLCFVLAAGAGVSTLSGCALGSLSTPVSPQTAQVTISGHVHGGEQAISGATVELWETGTTGYGTGAAQLVASTTSALQDGYFTFPTANVPANCTTGPYAYLTASGGDPTGTTLTAQNHAILLAAMSPVTCTSTGATTNVDIDEITTVATAYALSNFATVTQASGTSLASLNIGAPSSNAQGLADAVANALLLANPATGTANVSTPTTQVPTALIDTLADAIARCVNATESTAFPCANQTSPAVSGLFTLTTPPASGSTAPTNIFQAALNMAKYPGSNAGSILSFPTGQVPFSPTLAYTPSSTSVANDLTVAIAFPSATLSAASSTGIGLAIDSSDNILYGGTTTGSAGAYTDYVAKLTKTLSGATETISTLPSTVGTYATPGAAAVDANNTFWLTDSSGGDVIKIPSENTANATQIYLTSPDGQALSTTSTANAADLAQNTYGIAIDGSNNIWTVAYRSQGNCASTGTTKDTLCDLEELPGGTGTTGSFVYKFGSSSASFYGQADRYMAIDSSTNTSAGSVWLPNYGGTSGNNVAIVAPALGSSTTPGSSTSVAIGGSSSTYGGSVYGVAIDSTGGGWVTLNTPTAGSSALYHVAYTPPAYTPPVGSTAGSATATAATGYSPGTIASTATSPGSTSTTSYAIGGGNAARNVAIDGAGNVFYANYGFKSLVEYSPTFTDGKNGSTLGGYLSPTYGFAPTLATPVSIYSYSIAAATGSSTPYTAVATFNSPNNLVVGQTVTLSGFTTSAGTFLNGQSVTVVSENPYTFTANVSETTSGTAVATTADTGVATPPTVPVTLTCTGTTTITCSLPGSYPVLGAVAIDKAGSVWTVGYNNGTLIEVIGTAAPTDPLLSDGKYGVKP